MSEMIIKVCGMTRADNIREVEALGADLMGFVFYPPSPRYVHEMPGYLPERARRVGVFVNESKERMVDIGRRFRLDYLQLHGEEPTALCRELRAEGFKIIRRRSITELQANEEETVADYLLFDTPTPAYGGSGQMFDWSVLQQYTGKIPFLLSGGIGPEIIDALQTFRHERFVGIDLNSRFETEPGVKDVALLRQFLSQLSVPHL
jgi:phosphoribosylanthranilate isomerase